MTLDFSQLRWTSLGGNSYEVVNRRDYYSIQLKGTSKRLFRLDWTHDYYNNHTQLVGYLHGTVEILGSEATIIHQKIYLGSNIVVIPPEIEKINNFYLHHYKAYSGKFTIQYYEPTTQVVINPFTNQPVILGQEALNSIENFNKIYSDQVIEELSQKITVNIASELNQLENQINTITILLHG